jgi:acyl-CoA synthetase (AMP-forming)/AMP-acid ligase II
VLLSIVIYRGIGFACLLTALLIGGKPIYIKLKERFRKKEITEKNQENE